MSEENWQDKSTLPVGRYVELCGAGWEGHGTVDASGNIHFDEIVSTDRRMTIGGADLISGWRECGWGHGALAA